MRRHAIILTFALALGTAPAPLRAASCALDNVPAATLLLPYFEVDLADPAGRTTLMAINNASDRPALAHVVLWTDLGVPTLAFDVYLTGYDVQTLNLRDVFRGVLPKTADALRDPGDVLSPRGPLSQDAGFPGCEGLPLPDLPAGFVDSLQRAHTGRPAPLFGGQCAGSDLGQPQVARGYVTVDAVKSCTQLRPSDPGYFGPNGVAAYDNVLWGDFIQVDPAGKLAQGEDLVRLEADPARFGPGSTTFYGRYVNGSGADAREPLAAEWSARFFTGGGFDGGTELLVWRSPTWAAQPFPCGAPPNRPLRRQAVLYLFDEQESFVDTADTGILDPPPPNPGLKAFTAVANRVPVGGADLPVPWPFGWMQLDLRPAFGDPADPYAQAWVGQVATAQNRFSVGFEGTQLGSLCPSGRCFQGSEAMAGELCVLGPLAAGQPAQFTVAPRGCFSSSCTRVVQAGCAVRASGNELRLDALVCHEAVPLGVCTPDCSGGGLAQCSSGALAAGSYTARLGELTLAFQVPSVAGACVGSR